MTKKSCLFLCFLLLQATELLHSVPPNTVVATMNVGVTPGGLALTPDNNFAYVANNNEYGVASDQQPTPPFIYNVTVLNLTNNTVETTIYDNSFSEPYRVAVNKAGTKAYVCNSNATTVSIIDIATNTVLGTVAGGVFDGPSGIAVTPDGNFAYVSNYGVISASGTTVQVIDLNTDSIVGLPITVGLAPSGLAVSPDGKFVYVISYRLSDNLVGNGSISIIDTSNNTAVVDVLTGFSGPFGIAITPDGRYAYVTNFGSNNFTPIGTTVSVVDLQANPIAIVDTINLGIQPAGIALTVDGRFAYVTNYNALYAGAMFTNLTPGQGTVNIIDLATNTIIPPTIALEQGSNAIAMSSTGEFAYVTNYVSNTVNVIALQSFQIEAQSCKIFNRFLMHIDLVNKITWTVSGTSLPVSYDVYRDAELTDLAGTIDATEPFVFYDHNRNPNVVYTYYIVGTNAVGTTSEPVAVIVTQSC